MRCLYFRGPVRTLKETTAGRACEAACGRPAGTSGPAHAIWAEVGALDCEGWRRFVAEFGVPQDGHVAHRLRRDDLQALLSVPRPDIPQRPIDRSTGRRRARVDPRKPTTAR
jgi:hypothetical protein